jgi:two-component system, NarL family, sensor histidine kinase UhpB
MSLRLTINLIVGALTLLFTIGVMALQLRNMRESVNEEVVAANRVASQLLNRTVWRYAAQGTPSVLAFLQNLGRVRSNDITLFDDQDQELYRSPPSPYKAGRDAPEWFAARVAPALSVQSFDFPGGKIEVRANASRAVLDAWDDLLRLAAAALALLLAANAAVFWLVGRATRPFARIVDALQRVQGGRFDTALPPLPGREAGAIGSAFNRMVGELRTHIETERRAARAEAQLNDSRELTRWIDQQLEAERRMIARELHDELGQSVTAMRSLALSIEQRVGANDAPSAQAARIIADESSRLYDAMHGIIPRLAPLVLDNFGLLEALDDLVERTRCSQQGVGIETQFDIGNAPPLPPEAALTLYRAAQEGLTNALRHGQAQQVHVALQGDARGLTLTVADDGRGLPAEGWRKPGHYGLRWLDERAQSLGGELRLEANVPRGVKLEVRIPLPPAAQEKAAP